MRVPIYQIDSFTTRRFSGNPAAVVCLEEFLSDEAMLAIAAENNLAETAFLVPDGVEFRLRWFTPKVEVPLCGHATLASAAVIMERLDVNRRAVAFSTKSGVLKVTRSVAGYVMDFPSRPSQPVSPPAELLDALRASPTEVCLNQFNYMAVFADAQQVRALEPDMAAVARLNRPGVIATAPGDGGYDFVSRYFAPAKGIPEDPVTGAAHCMTAPYWAARLGKAELRAYQASARGGEVGCRVIGDRVELEGSCVFYLEGEIEF